jgi:hypothetical protein
MITVCCIKWGDKFGPEYVNRLAAGVRRNIHRNAFDFVCFTENPQGIDPEIRTAPLLCDYPGWWQKLGLFRPEVPGITTDRILYFDLACVIVGELDPIIELDADFAICRIWPPEMTPDANNHIYASGAFLLRVGFRTQVWDNFDMSKATPFGDQLWIEQNAPGAYLIPYDWSPSYKMRRLEGGIPPGAKWVMFHGVPKPAECGGWVRELWRK